MVVIYINISIIKKEENWGRAEAEGEKRIKSLKGLKKTNGDI